MKQRKRMLAGLLIMILLLAGCGGSRKDLSGKVTPNETRSTQAAEEEDVSLGRLEGGVYTNSYAGFACTLDSNWVFYSAQDLQELPGNIQELLKDTEAGDSLAELNQITDMKAENTADLTTVNVLYTKLDTATRLVYAVMSEEDIVDTVLEQKDMIVSTYAQAGIEVAEMEKISVDFLGESHFAVRTSSSWDGIPYFTLQIYDYHAGPYGIITTFASYVEDRTEDLLSLFYKVE